MMRIWRKCVQVKYSSLLFNMKCLDACVYVVWSMKSGALLDSNNININMIIKKNNNNNMNVWMSALHQCQFTAL